ncbi:hypothetical protein [Undibacterium luofuense]|uniref:type IV pilus assembly protein FimV n=1 Tax=Undibacterium luofuense TaxID=2828733 RepID=UPI0030EB7336
MAAEEAGAVALSGLRTQSYLGQPFKGQLEMTGPDALMLDSSCLQAQVETPDGIFISPVNISLTQRNNAVSVSFQSRKPIHEPAIKLVIKVACEVQLSREYLLLLDPGGNAAESLAVVTGGQTVRQQVAAERSSAKAKAGAAAESNGSKSEIVSQRNQPKASESKKPKTERTPKSAPVQDALKLSDQVEMIAQGMKMSQSLSLGAANNKSGAQDVEELRQAQAHFAAMLRGEAVAPAEVQTASKADQSRAETLQKEAGQLKKQLQLEKAQLEELRENSVSESWMWALGGLLAAALASSGLLYAYVRRLHRTHSASWWEQTPAKTEPEQRKNIEELVNSVQAAYATEPHLTDVAALPEMQSQVSTPKTDSRLRTSSDQKEQELGNLETHSVFGRTYSPSLEDTNSSTFNFFATPKGNTLKVEEISDVTQEAEFWMSVNDPERAIEILEPQLDVDHPDSPVPWLYLLDLYRMVNKKEEYDELRDRFVVFFNANIPEFETDPSTLSARHLDDFEHLVKRICSIWDTNEAIPFLESLLIDDRDGKRMGFELPVYRDILLLISIAHELEKSRAHGGLPSLHASTLPPRQLPKDPLAQVVAQPEPEPENGNLIDFEIYDFRKPDESK